MSDTAHAPPTPAATEQLQLTGPPGSTPVIIRSETQVPQQFPVSKDATFNVTQAAVYLGFVVLLVSAVVASMKWLDGKLEKLGGRFGEELKEVKADVKAAEVRILETEKATVALDKRLTLQERESQAFKEGQVRIEHQLEKMERTAKEGRAELLDTIRDMSKRDAKS